MVTNDIKRLKDKLNILEQPGLFDVINDLVNGYDINANMGTSKVLDVIRRLKFQYQKELKDILPEEPIQQKLF